MDTTASDRMQRCILCISIWAVSGTLLHAAPLTCDLSHFRAVAGLEASVDGDHLVVHWDGEAGQKLIARFGLADGVPVVRELAIEPRGGTSRVLARDMTPEFAVT